jgi:hypothetical protein
MRIMMVNYPIKKGDYDGLWWIMMDYDGLWFGLWWFLLLDYHEIHHIIPNILGSIIRKKIINQQGFNLHCSAISRLQILASDKELEPELLKKCFQNS